MQVSFYLKRANAEDSTSLYSRLTYAGNKVKYFCPEKIDPKYWDSSAHRAKRSKSFPEHPEFNQRLDDFEKDIKNIFRRLVNDSGGQIPNEENLKAALDAHFRPSKAAVQQSKDLIGFLKDLIARSEMARACTTKQASLLIQIR